jgi:hypothetical protein
MNQIILTKEKLAKEFATGRKYVIVKQRIFPSNDTIIR